MKRYNPKEIEPKWQKIWDKEQTYRADLGSDKPKYYAMSMLNYPSGAGIHIGHAMNYTISDVMARFKRQQGYESYHPVGWDAFGLPAENYAIKTGVSPQKSMAQIIPHYHKQYKAMGWSNDWSREVSTHEPQYYKWTQWIFNEMYRHGLVYQDSRPQWWCAVDNTVLADEQVTADGKCWRHDGPNDPPVEKREIKQWFFRITDYTEELLEAIKDLDWTESVKSAQQNWIGKSQGAEIIFEVEGSDKPIKVFTTRPDTIFGATFLVLAPEHELVSSLTTKDKRSEVEAYQAEVAKKTDVQRQADKEKTGVFTGSYAINPANEQKIPIWISEYVLTGYGTGAIMAVPGHDQRDYEFAKKYDLPVQFVIEPTFGEAQGDDIQSEKIFVALRSPQKDKVIVLDWGPRRKNYGGYMMIGGSVEDGEEHRQAAEREIREETGYKNFKFVNEAEFKGHGYFYSNTKHINVHASGKGLLYDLIDETQDDSNLDHGEKGKFKVTWQPIEKAGAMLHDGVHEAMYKYLVLGEVYPGEGVMINSGDYDGMSSTEVREKIVVDLAQKGLGQEKTICRLKDWSVSRQRYWGAPIPIIHCEKCGPQLVPDEDLPVVLPELADFEPSGDGRSALARATEWLKVSCPKCGGKAERETDTMDTYVDSAWYFLRYLDPKNDQQIFDHQTINKWMPLDFYNGADHATAHMIYARFVTRFFNKIGLIEHKEPFKKFLFNGKVVDSDGKNFSKSKGNGPDPLDIIGDGYGADALRTYLMFAAPLDQWVRWDPKGVPGTYRFLNRIWNLVQEYVESNSEPGENQSVLKAVHRTIKKVTEDIEHQHYNTAIAAMMACTNELYIKKAAHGFTGKQSWQFVLESLAQLVAPFAPHIAEELWQQLGHKDTVHKEHWPEWDERFVKEDKVTVAVQVNGKVRSEISLAADEAEEAAVEAAKQEVAGRLEGPVKKAIYVPGRIVNLVT